MQPLVTTAKVSPAGSLNVYYFEVYAYHRLRKKKQMVSFTSSLKPKTSPKLRFGRTRGFGLIHGEPLQPKHTTVVKRDMVQIGRSISISISISVWVVELFTPIAYVGYILPRYDQGRINNSGSILIYTRACKRIIARGKQSIT